MGRANAAHSQSAFAVRASKPTRGAFIRHLVEYPRRRLSVGASQCSHFPVGDYYTCELSSDLHSAETPDAAVYALGRVSGSDAYPDRVGRIGRFFKPAIRGVVCRFVPLAVSPFFGDSPHVSRGLFARRLSNVASLRP